MIRAFRFRPRVFCRHLNAFDKYKSKLELRAKEKGISLSELLDNSQPEVEKLRKDVYDPFDLVAKANQPKAKSKEESTPKNGQSTAEAIRQQTKSSENLTQDLNTFVDAEKFALHSRKEIEMLWKARFLNSAHEFSGTLDGQTFARLYLAARKYPTFVLPLPHKEEGIELQYVQWSFVGAHTIHCLITSLAEYKLHNEYAHPHTTIMIHSDFVMDKEIGLLNAIVQTKEISLDNAIVLALNLQRFYTADAASPFGAKKLDLMRKFNTGDTSFSVDALIEATETLD